MDPVEEHVKKTIVTAARETWEIYFSRLFPASVSVCVGGKLPEEIVYRCVGELTYSPRSVNVCLCECREV